MVLVGLERCFWRVLERRGNLTLDCVQAVDIGMTGGPFGESYESTLKCEGSLGCNLSRQGGRIV